MSNADSYITAYFKKSNIEVSPVSYINICGFETGDKTECLAVTTTGDGTATVQSSIKRTGSYALQTTSSQNNPSLGYIRLGSYNADGTQSVVSHANVWIRFYLYIGADVAGGGNVAVCYAGNVAGTDGIGVSMVNHVAGKQRFNMFAGSLASPTVFLTGTTDLNLNQWYRIELQLNNSGATLELKVDGTVYLTDAATETGNYSNYYFGRCAAMGGSNSSTNYFDDISINDTGYPGASQCGIMLPSGDSATNTGWTASSGSKFAAWNTVPTNASTPNNSANSNTAIYTSTLGQLAGVLTVNAVKPVLLVKHTSGTPTVTVQIRSGSTNNGNGTPVDPGASNQMLGRVLTTDPTDSNPWTATKLASLETGAELNASAGAVAATFAAVMVDYVPDTTPPTFSSASVDTTGLNVAVELTETGSPPILPASSVTGYVVKVGGVSQTISSTSRTGSTEDTIVMAVPIQKNATVTLDYSPGNVTDSALNAMLAFSGQSVTNNSTFVPSGGSTTLKGGGGGGNGNGRGGGHVKPVKPSALTPGNVIYGARRR